MHPVPRNTKPRLWDFMVRLGASAILLHALVIGPLLVQCIPSDGRNLTELVGYDPCRQGFRNAPTLPGAPEAWLPCDHDSCVDLMIDNPGITMAGIAITSGMALGTHFTTISAEPGDLSGPFVFTTHELARGPGLEPSPVVFCRSSLRI
jgi:hypothetical protein